MMVINNTYDFNDLVYLKTDEDQKKRIVIGIKIVPSGEILYLLSCGTICSEHYEFEISVEKDVLISTSK